MKCPRRLLGFKHYLEAEDLGERTVLEYISVLKNYFATGRDFNQSALRDYKKEIKTKLSPATVNTRIAAINKYGKYKDKEGCHLDPIKIQRRMYQESILTKAQYTRLIDGLIKDGNVNGYAEIRLLACTGLRASEAIQVTIKDLQAGSMDILGKGTKIRTCWFPKVMREDLLRILSDREPEDRIISCAVRTLGSHLARYAEEYNIPRKLMHPHEFRRFYARNFNLNKNNLPFLQALLGHSNVETTASYMRTTKKEIGIKVSRTVKW